MEEKKMDMKYYIGILCAVTVVVGAIAGVSVSAEDNADINEITKTFSMENLIEKMEMKGFEVTVEGDTVTAYREYPGKTITMTFECPDGECTSLASPEGIMHKKAFMKTNFRFRMGDGSMDPEAFQAKLENMGMSQEDIDAMKAKFAEMGYRGCPFAETSE